jgi:5-hydroxyisourate hydrolase
VISTHVLDTAQGRPAAGVKVALYRGDELISLRETDSDGRIAELAAPGLEPGDYRLVFDVEGAFFARVDLTIAISDPDAHYHVPLLVSPFACVTYRGS